MILSQNCSIFCGVMVGMLASSVVDCGLISDFASKTNLLLAQQPGPIHIYFKKFLPSFLWK